MTEHPMRAALLTLILAATITALSLTPLPHLPEAPGSDKLHHVLAYAAAALPTALWHPRARAWVIPALAALSGAIELIQPWVNRFGEWHDFWANLAGLGLGLAIGAALRRSQLTES